LSETQDKIILALKEFTGYIVHLQYYSHNTVIFIFGINNFNILLISVKMSYFINIKTNISAYY